MFAHCFFLFGGRGGGWRGLMAAERAKRRKLEITKKISALFNYCIT
jgi:hypothetical protein